MKILLGFTQKLSVDCGVDRMNKFIGVGLYEYKQLSTISHVWEVLILIAGMAAIIAFICFLCEGKRTFLISIGIMVLGFIEWTFIGLWATMAFCILAQGCRTFYWITDNYDYFNKLANVLSDTVVSLDFATIKNLYNLNPKRFYFDGYRECVYTPNHSLSIDVCIPKKIEYVKYTLWKYRLQKDEQKAEELKKKSEKNKCNAKASKIILDQAQLDIEALRKQAEAEINEAMSTIKKVQSNLIGEELR